MSDQPNAHLLSDVEVVRLSSDLLILRTQDWAIPLNSLEDSDIAEILSDVESAAEQLGELLQRAVASAPRAAKPNDSAARDSSQIPGDLLQIGVRGRQTIVLLGDNIWEGRPVDDRLRGNRWCIVHFADVSTSNARELSSYVYPPRPRWTKSLPQESLPTQNSEVADEIADVRLVVCALQNAPYAEVFSAIEAYGQFGIPVFPITFSSAGATVGPLVVGGNMTGLVAARFGRSPELLDPDMLKKLALFSTGSGSGLEPDGWKAIRSEISRYAFETSAADMARYVHVSPQGECEHYALGLQEIARTRRLRGTLWSIENFLALSDRDLRVWNDARKHLDHGALLSIRDAFIPEFADVVYKALDEQAGWELHETISDGFYFHGHVIYDFDQLGPCLALLHMIFDSEETIRWATDVSGVSCTARATAFPSWYMPGDQITMHNDRVYNRVLAFIWHLTRDWHSSWGGDLVWCTTGENIPPSFNTLHLMAVQHGQQHTVTPVSPKALGKRLCWNGWWKSLDEVAPIGDSGSKTISLGEGKFIVRPLPR